MATKIKKKEGKGAVERVVEAAATAAEELGAAASSFKQSWKHVAKARAKAKPATTAVKRVASATVRKAKNLLPSKRKAKVAHRTHRTTTARSHRVRHA